MKKKIALISLAAILLLSGIAGGVYAVSDHQPVRGEKLIGMSHLGTALRAGGNIIDTRWSGFRFTNPDGVGEITITQVSIIRGDETLIYEGPYIRVVTDINGNVDRTVITDPMTPHETRGIRLTQYMWDGPDDPDEAELEDSDNWLDRSDALGLDFATYTVEIAWEAQGPVAPLTGWQVTSIEETRFGDEYRYKYESQMVNLKQKK